MRHIRPRSTSALVVLLAACCTTLFSLGTGLSANPQLTVGILAAYPNTTRTVSFTLTKNGIPVSGIFVDINFSILVHGIPSTPVLGPYDPVAFTPAQCRLVPNIDRRVRFTLYHENCYYHDELQEPISPCTAFKIRAYVYNVNNFFQLPNGELFTCDFRVSPFAPGGSYAITADGWASVVAGEPVELQVTDGYIGVGYPPTPGSSGGSC